jgi:hypothetical protein
MTFGVKIVPHQSYSFLSLLYALETGSDSCPIHLRVLIFLTSVRVYVINATNLIHTSLSLALY